MKKAQQLDLSILTTSARSLARGHAENRRESYGGITFSSVKAQRP